MSFFVSKELFFTSTFFEPSGLKIIPCKWISSFLINAKAPIGALHPPSNLLKKLLSIQDYRYYPCDIFVHQHLDLN